MQLKYLKTKLHVKFVDIIYVYYSWILFIQFISKEKECFYTLLLVKIIDIIKYLK